jgi:hypothetical protein
MVQISDRGREICQYIMSALEVTSPNIRRFWDSNRSSSIDIFEAVDCPQLGVKTYSTIGLSNYPLLSEGKEISVRTEFIGACGSAFPKFDNVISTLAFLIINSRWFCAPGKIFPDVLLMHEASITMSDVYFCNQFLWGDKLNLLNLGDQKISWLMAMPISRKEAVFAQKNGAAKLEELLAENDIDFYNLNRPSVL